MFVWIVAILAFLAADFALGVKIGRMLKRDEPDDSFAPLPRHLPSQVPLQLHPHTSWSDVKDGRSTPPPSDPAS